MIELEKLYFGYHHRSQPLFQNLSLKVESGKIVGLLGKNGAGKTSLCRLIAGLVFSQKGKLTVLDHTPSHRHPTFLQNIYFVPQELPDLSYSIETFIRLYSGFYPKFSLAFFKEAMTGFDLDYCQRLSALSYGQKKKMFIAFALATRVRCVLLDEPTNGLDIPSKQAFRQVLIKAASPERTFIISTHQVNDLEECVDSLIMLGEGQKVYHVDLANLDEGSAPSHDGRVSLENLFLQVINASSQSKQFVTESLHG